MKNPETIPILSAMEAIGKMSVVPFPESDINLLGPTESMSTKDVYTFGCEIIRPNIRFSKPLTHEIGENPRLICKAMKKLEESGKTAHSMKDILEKLDEMKATIAYSTSYKVMKVLQKEKIVIHDEEEKTYALVNKMDFDEFPKIKLPKAENLFPERDVGKNPCGDEITDLFPQPSEVPEDSQQAKEIESSDEFGNVTEEKDNSFDVNDPGSPMGDIDVNISEASKLSTNKEAQVSKGVDSSPSEKKRGRPPKNQQGDNPSKGERQVMNNPESDVTPPEKKISEGTDEITSPTPLAEETPLLLPFPTSD